MPIPNSSVGKAISFLSKENPGMSQAQKVAIALSVTGKSKYNRGHVKKALSKV